MKIKLLSLILILTQTLYAQTFTEIPSVFDGVQFGSIAFSDIDSDGDEDLLITGENSSDQRIAKLYTNDGTGNFAEVMGTSFDGVQFSSIAFSDVDGDGDEDLLITGRHTSVVRIAKLYINNGIGNFTEVMGTPFDGVQYSSTAFSDVDGDGDEDLLITGLTSTFFSFEVISKLYTNDGVGSFTEVTDTPFDDVRFSSIAFSDVDDDGDEDLLITGNNSSDQRIAKLYTNNGMGSFTEVVGTPFERVWDSSIAFSDVDDDGDEDLLITGNSISGGFTSKLYTNGEMISSNEDIKLTLNHDFMLFPNPTTSKTVYLTYNSAKIRDVTIKVFNSNGHILSQQKEFVITGQQTFSIHIASLAKGSYFIELDNGESTGVAKLVVQ